MCGKEYSTIERKIALRYIKKAQEIGRIKQTLAKNTISKNSLMVNLLTNNLLDCTDASFISCFMF